MLKKKKFRIIKVMPIRQPLIFASSSEITGEISLFTLSETALEKLSMYVFQFFLEVCAPVRCK